MGRIPSPAHLAHRYHSVPLGDHVVHGRIDLLIGLDDHHAIKGPNTSQWRGSVPEGLSALSRQPDRSRRPRCPRYRTHRSASPRSKMSFQAINGLSSGGPESICCLVGVTPFSSKRRAIMWSAALFTVSTAIRRSSRKWKTAIVVLGIVLDGRAAEHRSVEQAGKCRLAGPAMSSRRP